MNVNHSSSLSPEISIVMTVYNTGKYIAEAIESVLAQNTFRTWELLIVDDGSTDESLAIVHRYASRNPERIFVHRHPGGINRGISASRNLALQHARGSMLAFLDSDDVWLSHHLDTMSALLERMPHIALAYASAERWVHFEEPLHEETSRRSSWGENYIPPLLPAGYPSGMLPRGVLLRWFRADESLVPCICTVMMRTAVARAVGGFCNAFRGLYDDQAFYAKLMRDYDIYAHDRCVARYRQHAESCCARAREIPSSSFQDRRLLENFLSRCGHKVHAASSIPTQSCSQ